MLYLLILTALIVVVLILIVLSVWYLAPKSSLKQEPFQPQDKAPLAEISVQCPKCNIPMEAGFIPEYTHQGIVPDRWMRGLPEWRVWIGGVRLRVKDMRLVITYRCPSCGYLEAYAK